MPTKSVTATPADQPSASFLNELTAAPLLAQQASLQMKVDQVTADETNLQPRLDQMQTEMRSIRRSKRELERHLKDLGKRIQAVRCDAHHWRYSRTMIRARGRGVYLKCARCGLRAAVPASDWLGTLRDVRPADRGDLVVLCCNGYSVRE